MEEQTGTPITRKALIEAGFERKYFENTEYFQKKTLMLGFFFGKWILIVS